MTVTSQVTVMFQQSINFRRSLLIVCAAFIFLGLEGIAFAPNLTMLRIAIFIIGFGGGVINGGTNALVADISKAGKSAGLSILGVFFGIGAVGVLFLLWLLPAHLSFESIIAGVGAFLLIPIIFMQMIHFPLPKQAQGFPLKDGLKLLKELPLLLFGFILFFESGIEITIGS